MVYLPGTFGQDQKWKLGDPSTYQHPLAPKDVLMDQDSLPSTITKVHTTISPAEVEDVKTGMVGLEYKEREELSDTSEDDMSVTDIGNDVSCVISVWYNIAAFLRLWIM